MKTILQYPKATRDTGITYRGEQRRDLTIKRYSNSDWASDHTTRKSMSGYIFMLNGGLVSWCLKRQSIVAFFSTKVEYVALTLASKETTWLQLLLTKLDLLLPNNQYVKIKIAKGSKDAK